MLDSLKGQLLKNGADPTPGELIPLERRSSTLAWQAGDGTAEMKSLPRAVNETPQPDHTGSQERGKKLWP